MELSTPALSKREKIGIALYALACGVALGLLVYVSTLPPVWGQYRHCAPYTKT